MTRAFSAIFAGIFLMLSLAAPVAAGMFEDAEAAVRRGDYVTALRLYRSLADQGDAHSQVKVGVIYALGKAVKQSDVEAVKWYKLAASQGDALGQMKVGIMYALGKGVKQNDAEAAKWYRLAAGQGNALAQALLGSAYTAGKGVSKNDTEAAKWFYLAANQGDADAQFMLGLTYVLGKGVPQNYVAAHMWLSLSAAQGGQLAAKRRDETARLMTAAQVAEAQKLAEEWRPTTANASPEVTPDSPPPRKTEVAATSGTAFFVSRNGEALTNAHVVENCQQIRANNGTARLLARDIRNDLALLATDQRPAQWSNWRLSVRQGEDIVVYGFPLTGMLSSGGNVVTGNVTALAGLEDDSRFLQISAPVQPGNSGGPLFDRFGNIVGIVVSKLNATRIASATGDIPQNVNFAIKASVAAAFLDAQRVTISTAPPPPPGYTLDALSTPDIAARAQALALQVVCLR